VMLLLWAMGRLLSDAYLWSQWLAWLPTPAAIAAAALGLLCAARPSWRDPAPRARAARLTGWGALLGALVLYFAGFEHKLFAWGGDAPNGLTIDHWNVTAKRAVDPSALVDAIIDDAPDVMILTNADIVVHRKLWRWAMNDGRTVQLQAPFTVITRLPLELLRPLVAVDDIHTAELTVMTEGGEPLTFWLVDFPSDPGISRMRVADRARELLAQKGALEPQVIIGDFNMTRGSASLRRFAPNHRHAFELAGRGYGATYRRRWPMLHIDHALVAPGVKVAAYRLRDPGVGEHRMQRLVLVP
ncbi:MAG: endonuclease/exonuclease/phosphatase family protein, partial [Planctomycetota bacterium]